MLVRKSVLILIWIVFSSNAISQSGTIVPLNRVLHAERSIKALMYGHDKDSNIHVIGGDYSDADAEFTIALLDENNNGKYDDYYSDDYLIVPYKSDSVELFPGRNGKSINYYKIFTLRVGTKEYSARISEDGKSVEISRLVGNYIEPDIEFFDRIPENPYVNMFGDSSTLSSLEHKNKMIYVDFWETNTERTIMVHDSLKDIYAKYKNNLSMVSLDYADTDKVKVRNLVSRNHYEWEHGFVDFNFRWLFIQGFVLFRRPYGALFDSNGKLIKLFEDDSPKNLEVVLNEYLKAGN